MKITVGCDPELFLRRKSDGQFYSAHGILPGTKQKPFKVDKGAYQIDGMALEFNTDPASTADEFEHNIRCVMEQMREAVPDEYEFALEPTATFSREHFDLQPEEAKELGCEPDFNAYTLQENPRPDNKTTMRTASGHVHLGFCSGADVTDHGHLIRCATLVKQLDWYLGVPSLLYDQDERRRTMYGQAGAFRPKEYGCEYRVLSNKWLSDPKYIRWVFNQCVRAVDNLVENKGEIKIDAETYFNTHVITKYGYGSVFETAKARLASIYNYETSPTTLINMSHVLEGFPK